MTRNNNTNYVLITDDMNGMGLFRRGDVFVKHEADVLVRRAGIIDSELDALQGIIRGILAAWWWRWFDLVKVHDEASVSMVENDWALVAIGHLIGFHRKTGGLRGGIQCYGINGKRCPFPVR